MYIRFVIGLDNDDPRKMHGPFTEVEKLRKEGALAAYEEEQVTRIFEKFNEELPCPPWSSNNWPVDAISWFKVSSQSFVSQMYVLVYILREHGINVRVIKAKSLFKFFYEDEYQVIAVDKRF